MRNRANSTDLRTLCDLYRHGAKKAEKTQIS